MNYRFLHYFENLHYFPARLGWLSANPRCGTYSVLRAPLHQLVALVTFTGRTGYTTGHATQNILGIIGVVDQGYSS